MSLSLTGDAALSTTEAEHLADCETIIAAGLASFVEVGGALADVRDRRLYRQAHGTFEDYCSDRWGLSHRHVNRMVEASQVVGALGPIGPTPANEAQARPLAPLRDDPEALASAWRSANEAAEAKGKPVTAADVAAAVKAQQPAPEGIEDEGEYPLPRGNIFDDGEWERGPVGPPPAADPTPPSVGSIEKSQPTKARRAPLGDAAAKAGWEFRRAVERLERITADDRFPANREQVAAALRGHLTYATEVVPDLLRGLDTSPTED